MRFAFVTAALFVSFVGARAGEVVEIDGLKSKAPDHWKAGKPTSEMQRTVLTIPKAEGDPDNATLTVFYFGPGGGGSRALYLGSGAGSARSRKFHGSSESP